MSASALGEGLLQGASLRPRRGPSHAPRLFRFAIATASKRWRGGALQITAPSGEVYRVGSESAPVEAVLQVRDWGFVQRVLRSGDIGLADGYMAGEWDTPDVAALLIRLSENYDSVSDLARGGWVARLADRILYGLGRRNSREGSRRNIEAHYDLGNSFYAAWLDPSMTYSSALFTAPDQALEEAQRQKYAALADAMDLQPGQSVLEIGCGWGGFAEYAAKERGVTVTGLTLSHEQHAFARERLARAGLAERTDIRLQDYRDVRGQFDRIASIEMFEAVGEAFWPTYFGQLRDLLRPGGKAGLQIITIRDELFADYRSRIDFIRRYIFPGGLLPSEARLREETARASLAWEGVRRFGQDYARTLNAWRTRFDAVRDAPMGEQFRRLWRFYLAYCEAGFATERTNVIQLVLKKA